MVGTFTWKITGLKEFEAKLKGLGPAVATKIGSDALLAGAKPVTKRMRAMVPVRSGNLKKSITSRAVKTNGSLLSRIIGFKSPGRYYSHLVEFGTVHSSARPFVRPAIDTTINDVFLEMGRKLYLGMEAYAIGRVLATLDRDEE